MLEKQCHIRLFEFKYMQNMNMFSLKSGIPQVYDKVILSFVMSVPLL